MLNLQEKLILTSSTSNYLTSSFLFFPNWNIPHMQEKLRLEAEFSRIWQSLDLEFTSMNKLLIPNNHEDAKYQLPRKR